MMEPFGKLTLFGVAASAAVMAMGSDKEQAPEKNGSAKMQQVSMVTSPSPESVQPSEAEEKLEFERMLQQKQQLDGDKEVGNVFKATSWYVPPPPLSPSPTLPPPPPTAPPLPFTYFGQYKDAESSAKVVFLSNAERVYTVSEGDVIEGTYSVGPITSGQLELTYLPLNIKQSLNTGGAI
jgi:hypothetical protein